MMELPESIMIGGITYEIEFTDDLEGLAAQILFHPGKIQISDTLSNSVAFVSFIHEVMHAVLQQQSIFMNDRIYIDETFIETSAQVLSQVFQQLLAYNKIDEDINTLNIGVDL